MTHRSDLVVWIASLVLIIAALSTPVVPYEYDAGWWIPRAEWERAEAGAVIGLLRTPETLSLLQPWLGLHRHPTAAPITVGALGRLAPASFPIVRVAALWNAALLILVLVGLRRRLDSDDTPAICGKAMGAIAIALAEAGMS